MYAELESSGYGRGTRYRVYGLNTGLPDSNMVLPDANMALPDANMVLPDANMVLPKKRYSREEMRKLIV